MERKRRKHTLVQDYHFKQSKYAKLVNEKDTVACNGILDPDHSMPFVSKKNQEDYVSLFVLDLKSLKEFSFLEEIDSVALKFRDTSKNEKVVGEDVTNALECACNEIQFLGWNEKPLGTFPITSLFSNFTTTEVTALDLLCENKCITLQVVGNHNQDLSHELRLLIHVSLYHQKISRKKTSFQLPLRSTISRAMQCLMQWWIIQYPNRWNSRYPQEFSTLDESHNINNDTFHKKNDQGDLSKFETEKFYNFIKAQPFTLDGNAYVPDTSLIPELRSYQKAAVAWMIQRENHPTITIPQNTNNNHTNLDYEEYKEQQQTSQQQTSQQQTSQQQQTLQQTLQQQQQQTLQQKLTKKEEGFGALDFWMHLFPTPCFNQSIYYHPYLCIFSFVEPEQEKYTLLGGVLADEMGLGKTVEVLSLILSNPPCNSTNPRLFLDKSMMMMNTDQEEEKKTRHLQKGERENKRNKEEDHCICESLPSSEVVEWVNCELCHVWQHQECVGYSKEKESVFYCVQCESTLPLLEVKGTLIITPTSILKQWEYEIQRHVKVGQLKTWMYPGVKELVKSFKGSGKSWQQLGRQSIAQYDIVLTTYEALRSDIYHTSSERKSSRYGKRYRNIPSPLKGIHWWRICLDEAQLIESTTAKAAEMAVDLSSTFRWCISGTPISRGLEDLFGLFYFLHLKPWNQSSWWESTLLKPYHQGFPQRLIDLLRCILWRNRKVDVLDQIQLPPQSQEVIWLKFSEVEAHFYKKQEEECTKNLLQQRSLTVFHSESTTRKSRKSKRLLLSKYFTPLLRLRQACCHPQIGNFGLRSRRDGQFMTMDEILDELIQKARKECEEYQRQWIGARNGMAGIYVIQNRYEEAVECYVKSILAIVNHWKHFNADALQRLHLVQNCLLCLQTILKKKNNNTNNNSNSNITTNSSNSLQERKMETELKKSLLNGLSPIHSDEGESRKKKESFLPTNEQENTTTPNDFSFSTRPLSPCVSSSSVHDLPDCSHLLSALSTKNNDMETYLDPFNQSVDRIKKTYLAQVNSNHEILYQRFQARIQSTNNKFQDYPNHAFSFKSTPWWKNVVLNVKHEETFIESLRSLLQSRSYSSNSSFSSLKESFHNKQQLVLLLEQLILKFHSFRNVFISQLELLSQEPQPIQIAISGNCKQCRPDKKGEECCQCKSRKLLENYELLMYSYRKEGIDEISKSSYKGDSELVLILNWLKKYRKTTKSSSSSSFLSQGGGGHDDLMEAIRKEISTGFQLWVVQCERLSSLDELDMALTTMRLAHPDEEANQFILYPHQILTKYNLLVDEANTSKHMLDQAWSQLTYLEQLPKESEKKDPVVCAVCHEEMKNCDKVVLSCAHTFCFSCSTLLLQSREALKCPICRKRCIAKDMSIVSEKKLTKNGTKMDALIHSIDNIVQKDPNAKCLVFSQWSDMLDLVLQALQEKQIPCIRVRSNKDFHHVIQQFCNTKIAVLGLLFKNGANGLNLTAANHVFLLEPLLHSGVEAQAINRIFRIGQDKPTFVHRFLIQNTIEEKIFAINQTKKKIHQQKNNNEQITLEDLQLLFHSTTTTTSSSSSSSSSNTTT